MYWVIPERAGVDKTIKRTWSGAVVKAIDAANQFRTTVRITDIRFETKARYAWSKRLEKVIKIKE